MPTKLHHSLLLPGRGPASAAAEQINFRTHFAERVARVVDAIDPRDGIEADVATPSRSVMSADDLNRSSDGYTVSVWPGARALSIFV
jgi:hypothetical protein